MLVHKVYVLPFTLKQVYDAWVSSNTVIPPATAMDILPQVGGHYRLIMKGPEFTSLNEGTFSIVKPHDHLRYSWEWNNDGEVSEIDVKFETTREGTQVTLEHSGFLHQQSADMHASGWDSYIKGFEQFLSNKLAN